MHEVHVKLLSYRFGTLVEPGYRLERRDQDRLRNPIVIVAGIPTVTPTQHANSSVIGAAEGQREKHGESWEQ